MRREGTPAWVQVLERRREQAAEESSGLDNPLPQSGNDHWDAALAARHWKSYAFRR